MSQVGYRYLGTPCVGDAYTFCVVSSEKLCIQSPVHKPLTPGAGNFARFFKMYNESPSKQSIVKENTKEIGLWACLSGAQIVPKTKNKENQQKQTTHKENQKHKIREPSWPGLAPRMGCACAAESTTPIETTAKQQKQTKTKKHQTNKNKHRINPNTKVLGLAWPGPARMVPKLWRLAA